MKYKSLGEESHELYQKSKRALSWKRLQAQVVWKENSWILTLKEKIREIIRLAKKTPELTKPGYIASFR